jgi:hypothetical protein
MATIICQTEDCQLNLHYVQVKNIIEHCFEAIIPKGAFIDKDYLPGSIFMLKGMGTKTTLNNSTNMYKVNDFIK